MSSVVPAVFDTAQMQHGDPVGCAYESPRRAVETLCECNARLLRKVAQLESEAAQARYLAYHDSLTGLPNRVLLFDRLDQGDAAGYATTQGSWLEDCR